MTDRALSTLSALKTPYYVCDYALLDRNISTLNAIEQRAGCRVLFSLKSFNAMGIIDDFAGRISGYSAGSAFEFRHLWESQAHSRPIISIYQPAFTPDEIMEYMSGASFVVFNSAEQLTLAQSLLNTLPREPHANIGVRVNPEVSAVDKELYNPCRPRSHLGIKIDELAALAGRYSGLLIHNMCQSRSASEFCDNLDAIEQRLGSILRSDDLSWINLGGGSLFTAPGYAIDQVVDRLIAFRRKYALDVYLEPSEAWVLDTGFLTATVLDITGTTNKSAILDISVPAHIPDVLEIPYTPGVSNGKPAEVSEHSYTLCGSSCMSGDVVGTYEFDTPLGVGSTVTFKDMLPYSIVKSSFFNGIAKPDLYGIRANREIKTIKTYTYADYLNA